MVGKAVVGSVPLEVELPGGALLRITRAGIGVAGRATGPGSRIMLSWGRNGGVKIAGME